MPPDRPNHDSSRRRSLDDLLTGGDSHSSTERPLAIAKHRRRWPQLLAGLFAFLLCVAAASSVWYVWQLRPVDATASTRVVFVVREGASVADIAAELEQQNLIRSQLAFQLYVRWHDAASSVQAGRHSLSQANSVADVVHELQNGVADGMSITFFPGATLYDPRSIDDSTRTDVYTILRRAGYSDDEVRSALKKTYASPIFSGKPAGTSLEGYIYGETYQYDNDASAEEVLAYTFKEYDAVLKQNDIATKAKKQGLTLYQAITLASIVQREVHEPNDMKKVAQVFYSRLRQDISLGSDVTAVYAADQANVKRDVSIDSPYNTRRYTGLPPGPIASPGEEALIAVANPASTDYLYFVAGDDGKTYFAKTLQEHNENVKKYCTDLCKSL